MFYASQRIGNDTFQPKTSCGIVPLVTGKTNGKEKLGNMHKIYGRKGCCRFTFQKNFLKYFLRILGQVRVRHPFYKSLMTKT